MQGFFDILKPYKGDKAMYHIYTCAIIKNDKVILEIQNVFAYNRQEAISNAWRANVAQPYCDGKHKMVAYH